MAFRDSAGGIANYKTPGKEVKMDAPQSEVEKEMDDFAKRARERAAQRKLEKTAIGKKKGGSVKSSASKRADGIAQRGKTKGRMV